MEKENLSGNRQVLKISPKKQKVLETYNHLRKLLLSSCILCEDKLYHISKPTFEHNTDIVQRIQSNTVAFSSTVQCSS